MGLYTYVKEFGPKVFKYKLARLNLIKVPSPIVLTYSVTNKCQSRCKTCNLWKIYQKNPKKALQELKLDEIEKIFKSMDSVYFFNISGGEPFLRQDLPEIVKLACQYLNPKVIHTPTNALLPELIEKKMKEILQIIKESGKDIKFTIKPSFDGIEEKHDEIRGIKGNFEKVLDTVKRLKKLQKEYSNLDIGLGTVISKFNLDKIEEIAQYAAKIGVDSYINEIAEQRSELLTKKSDITPSFEEYKKAIERFNTQVKKIKFRKNLSKFTQAFRQEYYNLVIKILRDKKQPIPCYAGETNVHINPYGDVWPCCILGYDASMGNLKENNYDFNKVWYSGRARKIRRYIRNKKCSCPLANQAYSNILCSPKSMAKVFKHLIFN